MDTTASQSAHCCNLWWSWFCLQRAPADREDRKGGNKLPARGLLHSRIPCLPKVPHCQAICCDTAIDLTWLPISKMAPPPGTTAIWILRQPHKQRTGKQLTTHTKKAERRQDIRTRVQPLFQPKPHSAAEPSPLHLSFYLFPSTRTPWLIFRGRGRGSVLRGWG